MLSSGSEQAKVEPTGLQDKVRNQEIKNSELRYVYILY